VYEGFGHVQGVLGWTRVCERCAFISETAQVEVEKVKWTSVSPCRRCRRRPYAQALRFTSTTASTSAPPHRRQRWHRSTLVERTHSRRRLRRQR